MKEVIVLAGGNSDRMKPYIQFNKALLKIGKKSLLTYQLEWLAGYGFDHFVIATNEEIHDQWCAKEQVLSGKLSNLDISLECKKMGTAGAVRRASEYVKEDKIYVMNIDDILLSFNPVMLMDSLKKNGIVALGKPMIGFGLVRLRGDMITRFQEKPTMKYWVSTGHYTFAKDAIDSYFPEEGDLEKEVLPVMVKDKVLQGYKIKNGWHTINTVKDYLMLCKTLSLEPEQ